VLSVDPFNVGEPADLLAGRALMTLIGGEVVYDGRAVKETEEGDLE
jgi:hypothetical protein